MPLSSENCSCPTLAQEAPPPPLTTPTSTWPMSSDWQGLKARPLPQGGTNSVVPFVLQSFSLGSDRHQYLVSPQLPLGFFPHFIILPWFPRIPGLGCIYRNQTETPFLYFLQYPNIPNTYTHTHNTHTHTLLKWIPMSCQIKPGLSSEHPDLIQGLLFIIMHHIDLLWLPSLHSLPAFAHIPSQEWPPLPCLKDNLSVPYSKTQTSPLL